MEGRARALASAHLFASYLATPLMRTTSRKGFKPRCSPVSGWLHAGSARHQAR
jgi:hypothetical protein